MRAHPSLTEIRDYCAAQIVALPEDVVRLRDAANYAVRYSDGLVTQQQSLTTEVEAAEIPEC